jgi:hypothetical protein
MSTGGEFAVWLAEREGHVMGTRQGERGLRWREGKGLCTV